MEATIVEMSEIKVGDIFYVSGDSNRFVVTRIKKYDQDVGMSTASVASVSHIRMESIGDTPSLFNYTYRNHWKCYRLNI